MEAKSMFTEEQKNSEEQPSFKGISGTGEKPANAVNKGLVIAGMVGFVGVTCLAIVAALVLIFLNLPKSSLSWLPGQPTATIAAPTSLPARPQAKFNTAGDPNAPVKIIEYSDFQCPYCGRFASETEPQIMDMYVATGKVYFEYRSAGEFIGGPGGESIRAAEAAYCAGDQNKFWDMHDMIFTNQNGENQGAFSDARLTAFANKLGLDMTTFKDCFSSNKYLSLGWKDEQNALTDIQGASNFADLVAQNVISKDGFSTPSFLINGRLLVGAQPFDAFQKEIDAALKAAGK
jgi:protein-disulfide isomerase